MKINIRYALIIASVLIVINIIRFDLIGIGNEFVRRYSGIVPLAVLAGGLFLAIRKIRQETYKGEMNYGQALYSGIITGVFTALILGLFSFVYYQFVNPNYAETVISVYVPLMEKDGHSQEIIRQQIEGIRNAYKPVNQLTENFVFLAICSSVFSSVFSAFLRTKDTFTHIVKDKQ